MSYDPAGRALTTLDPLGYRRTTVYDAAGRRVAGIDAAGCVWTTVYDVLGQAIATLNPLGQRTTTVYDASKRDIATVDALGSRTTTIYDGTGATIASIDALGYRTTTLYDDAGRYLAQVNALGQRTTAVYDSFSRPVARIDARGCRSTTIYDAISRPAASQDALGYVTTTLFDAFGRRSGALNALGYQTTRNYDLLDRIVAQTDSAGSTTTTAYDPLDRAQGTLNALGCWSTSVYDSVGREIAGIDARGARVTAVYDLRGSQIARVNALGCCTTYVLDGRALQMAAIDPLARCITLAYDQAGRRICRTDGRGWVITYQLDPLGRDQTAQYQDGTRATMTYDQVSQVTGIADAIGLWTRTYDPLGRLSTETGPSHPNGQPLTHVFDATGNRTALIGWFGRLTTSYDARGERAGLVDPQGGLTTWAFDSMRQRVRQDNPDGTSSTTTYDPMGRAIGVLHRDGGGATLDQSLLSYDPVGNPLTKRTLDGIHTMVYDGVNQLLAENHPVAGVQTWSYDLAGNRLSCDRTQAGIRTLTSWAYDVADQILTETTGTAVITCLYDAAGNQQVAQSPTGITTQIWDNKNCLVGVQLPTGVLNTMSYREGGLRYRLVDSEGDKQMVWDSLGMSGQADLVEERSGGGALRTYYRGDCQVAMRDGIANQTSYYHCDYQGTTQCLTDSTGTVTDRFGADAFGMPVKRTGTSSNRHWYIGDMGYYQQLDQVVDYVRARHLDLGRGRWLSQDLWVPSDHLYWYVGNNPAVWIDPSGLQANAPFSEVCCCCVDAVTPSDVRRATIHDIPTYADLPDRILRAAPVGLMGHVFSIEVKLSYRKVQLQSQTMLRECRLAWWEWITEPVEGVVGAVAKKWVELYSRNSQNLVFKNWTTWVNRADKDRNCPQMPQTIVMEDRPTMSLFDLFAYTREQGWVTVGPRTTTRDLYIYVLVSPGEGCDCKEFPEGFAVRIHQHLEAQRGAPVWKRAGEVVSDLEYLQKPFADVGDPPTTSTQAPAGR
jgi:RHS repeat-associated protein